MNKEVKTTDIEFVKHERGHIEFKYLVLCYNEIANNYMSYICEDDEILEQVINWQSIDIHHIYKLEELKYEIEEIEIPSKETIRKIKIKR